MKEFLSHAGVDFVDRNVEQDEAAFRDLTAGGWRSVPVTVVGTTAVKGYDPEALRAAIATLDLKG